MTWTPHIIVKIEDDASTPTAITALKTFETGFPEHKAYVHYIGSLPTGLNFCKQWCTDGGHTFFHHGSNVKQSQLHYEIVKGTREPVVLIRGTTVFYEDMSDYSTTKLFAADTVPSYKLSDTVINIGSIEKTVIFVAKPTQTISKLEEITSLVAAPVAAEAKNSSLWNDQSVVMCGKVYHQTSGIFNMIYNYDESLFTNFTKATAEKYDTVFGGNGLSGFEKLRNIGMDPSGFMPYYNAAMNEDWEGVKGIYDVYLDMISGSVVK
tara:strand:+ start:2830 stop:3624 length:795 start_codon:yes stop_codon:yes gene_type:complete